jgi:hypothetical protein
MIFPRDEEKARIVVGWGCATESTSNTEPTGRDAASFAFIRDEVVRNWAAGHAVGEVIKALFALVSTDKDRHLASINGAIRVAQGSAIGRSTLLQHLSSLQPVLHLWGAWSKRDRRWPRDKEDLDFFLEEAEIILHELKVWNSSQPTPSLHLKGQFVSPYEGWMPRFDVKVHAISLPDEKVPKRMPPGRKRRPS